MSATAAAYASESVPASSLLPMSAIPRSRRPQCTSGSDGCTEPPVVILRSKATKDLASVLSDWPLARDTGSFAALRMTGLALVSDPLRDVLGRWLLGGRFWLRLRLRG